MSTIEIPELYKIDKVVTQDSYLVNGELKPWTGQMANVYSTISSTDEYAPTLLGLSLN